MQMPLTTAVLLVTLPLFSILVPLIQGLGNRIRSRMIVAYWSILGLFIVLGAVALILRQGIATTQVVLGVLSIDGFSVYFTAVFVVVTLLIAIGSIYYMRENKNFDTYFSLLLLGTFGMMLVAFSVDLVALFLAWELMNVPSYVLTGIQKDDPSSNEAAIKFFILSALSSALIIYAISIVFGITGTTNMYGVAQGLQTVLPKLNPLALLAMVLFIAGFGMKVAAVPFHMWIPDAYEGAPITIGAFLAAGTKNGGFAALFRVFADSVDRPAFGLVWNICDHSDSNNDSRERGRFNAEEFHSNACVLKHRASRLHPDRVCRSESSRDSWGAIPYSEPWGHENSGFHGGGRSL